MTAKFLLTRGHYTNDWRLLNTHFVSQYSRSFITRPALDIKQNNIMGEQTVVENNVSYIVSGQKNWK
jgi:hypothetical protein